MKTVDDWVRWLQAQGVGTSVRADEEGVCVSCWTPTTNGRDGTPYHQCYECRCVYGSALVAAVPISYSVPDGLMTMIWQAKNQASTEWLQLPLASLLNRFLVNHLSCLERKAGGVFDIVTVVPSHPGKRGGVDHLKMLHSRVTGWSQPWDLELLQKTGPSVADARRKALEPDLFAVSEGKSVVGKRILIVDDLFTSGGTIASAASALLALRNEAGFWA